MNTKGTIIMAALHILHSLKPTVFSMPSYMIPGPSRGGFQWSKRTMQRMKGKGARKNRGRNRRTFKVL